MKKNILLSAFAALFFLSFPANAEIRGYDYDMSEFTTVELSGNFEVILQEGAEYHVSLTVDDKVKEYVQCEKKGNTLFIGNSDKSLPTEIKKLIKNGTATFECKAIVTVKEPLKHIVLKDKAILSCSMPIVSETVKITVSDNAELKSVNVKCHTLELAADKKGSASVIADVDNLSVSMSGSSVATLTQKGQNVDVSAAGVSNLTLYCECDALTVNTKGTSKTMINGKSKDVFYTIGAASNVNALDLECDNASIKMNSVCTLTDSAKEKITLDLTGGSTLIFNNNPTIVIEQVKASNIKKYVAGGK